MKYVIGYFVSGFLRQLRIYVKFYHRIYKNIWNLPRAYDLTDKTLLIRSIKHILATATLVVIFSFLISFITSIGFLVKDSPIHTLLDNSEWKFIFIASFFAGQSSILLYLTNKIYPRNRLIFRECFSLSLLLFLALFPFWLLLLLTYALLELELPLIFSSIIIIVLTALIPFWNEKILLNLSIMKTIFFQFVLLLVFGILPFKLFLLASGLV